MKASTVGLCVLVAPIAAAMVLVGPGMVSRAEGCSGATSQPQPGWNGIYGVDQPNTPTTGVYVLHGQIQSISDEQALDGLSVTVQDAAGKPVAGSLALHVLSDAGTNYRDVLVTWKPDAPFAPNQAYSVTWTVLGSASSGGTATLTTVSDPVPSATTTVSVDQVGRRWQLEGELVSCSKVPYESHFDYNTCSTKTTGTPPFGSEETLLTEVTFRLALPALKPALTWLVRAEAVPGKGELVAPESAILLGTALSPEVKYPKLGFRGEAPEYCAKFVTEDLADGSTHSQEVCATPDPGLDPGPSLLEQQLAKCDAPPAPELEATWCKSHASAERCGGGSSGCSVKAPSRDPSGLAGAALLLAGLLVRRARARTRARQSEPLRR